MDEATRKVCAAYAGADFDKLGAQVFDPKTWLPLSPKDLPGEVK